MFLHGSEYSENQHYPPPTLPPYRLTGRYRLPRDCVRRRPRANFKIIASRAMLIPPKRVIRAQVQDRPRAVPPRVYFRVRVPRQCFPKSFAWNFSGARSMKSEKPIGHGSGDRGGREDHRDGKKLFRAKFNGNFFNVLFRYYVHINKKKIYIYTILPTIKHHAYSFLVQFILER